MKFISTGTFSQSRAPSAEAFIGTNEAAMAAARIN